MMCPYEMSTGVMDSGVMGFAGPAAHKHPPLITLRLERGLVCDEIGRCKEHARLKGDEGSGHGGWEMLKGHHAVRFPNERRDAKLIMRRGDTTHKCIVK